MASEHNLEGNLGLDLNWGWMKINLKFLFYFKQIELWTIILINVKSGLPNSKYFGEKGSIPFLILFRTVTPFQSLWKSVRSWLKARKRFRSPEGWWHSVAGESGVCKHPGPTSAAANIHPQRRGGRGFVRCFWNVWHWRFPGIAGNDDAYQDWGTDS